MRVLVLGITGMLGHKLWQAYAPRFDAWATVRRPVLPAGPPELYDPHRTITGVDARRFDTVEAAVREIAPEAIVNCIGVTKHVPDGSDPVAAIEVNSLFPHRLGKVSRAIGARLIHISTDCVFSGRTGGYSEADPVDSDDLYGRSKHLGEVTGPGCLTLRTSIIGREVDTSHGLVEWFVGARGTEVTGYRHAVFSGLTTASISRVIERLLLEHPEVSGLYHLSSEPISKLDLLCRLREALDVDVTINAAAEPCIDRSLDGGRLRADTGIVPPAWPAMIAELAADPTPYEQWRRPDGP